MHKSLFSAQYSTLLGYVCVLVQPPPDKPGLVHLLPILAGAVQHWVLRRTGRIPKVGVKTFEQRFRLQHLRGGVTNQSGKIWNNVTTRLKNV